GMRQRDRLLATLRDATPGGGLPAPGQLAPLWQRIGPEDVVVVLGDFFDDASADLVERLAAARRDVLAIQLLAVAERDFPFGDGPAMREGFLARFGQARRELQARFDSAGIRHAEYMLDEPLDLPLQRLFGSAGVSERP